MTSSAGALRVPHDAHEPQVINVEAMASPRRRSWFATFTMILNVLGTLLILLVAVLVNADIIGRSVFNQPVPGVTEMVGLSIVAIVFLQMSNTLREDRHVSNDLVVSWIGKKRPRMAQFLYSIFHLTGAVLMGLITWYVAPILHADYVGGFYKGTAGVIEIPTWPFMLIVIVGASATAIQYLLLFWRDLDLKLRPVQRP